SAHDSTCLEQHLFDTSIKIEATHRERDPDTPAACDKLMRAPEMLLVGIHKHPFLRACNQRGEIAHIRAGTAAEIEEATSRTERAHQLAETVRDGHVPCLRVYWFPQCKPFGAEPTHRFAASIRMRAASAHACDQRGNRARASRAPFAKRASTFGSANRRDSASRRDLASLGGTTIPASGSTRSGIAPVLVASTGSPWARASATTIPNPSCRVGSTNRSAAPKHCSNAAPSSSPG